MKILADRHHQGLTESLILLFGKRLGWEIFFQAGLEWYKEGFWNIYPHPSTAEQYLERELEGLPGITLEDFKNTKFDVLLCSIPEHVNIFLKLRDLYQPQAKLIFHVGNMWALDHYFPIKNILASAKMGILQAVVDFNILEYHQEFDLDIFHYKKVDNQKKVYSFINCLNTEELYKGDWELFLELEKLMPDWEFRSFGGQCRDGAIWDRKELADKMREATFIYQVKKNGDGYGHNVFAAAAIGRPLITRISDYKGKLAETLMRSRMTITIDYKTPPEIAEFISLAQAEIMGENIYTRFKEVVNFDEEEVLIRGFLDKLI